MNRFHEIVVVLVSVFLRLKMINRSTTAAKCHQIISVDRKGKRSWWQVKQPMCDRLLLNESYISLFFFHLAFKQNVNCPWQFEMKNSLDHIVFFSLFLFTFFIFSLLWRFVDFADVLSYVNVLTCAVRTQPWDCVYQRSGKMFDSIQDALKRKEDDIKGKWKSNTKTTISSIAWPALAIAKEIEKHIWHRQPLTLFFLLLLLSIVFTADHFPINVRITLAMKFNEQ